MSLQQPCLAFIIMSACGSIFIVFLVCFLEFRNQFNVEFSLSNICFYNLNQRKIKIELV